jgi:hypothetical protein
MTTKHAALLAFIGTLLTAVLLVYHLVLTILNVMRGLVPADSLFSSLVYAFASLSVALFFFVFHRQS